MKMARALLLRFPASFLALLGGIYRLDGKGKGFQTADLFLLPWDLFKSWIGQVSMYASDLSCQGEALVMSLGAGLVRGSLVVSGDLAWVRRNQIWVPNLAKTSLHLIFCRLLVTGVAGV
jgi:hypothetical protein